MTLAVEYAQDEERFAAECKSSATNLAKQAGVADVFDGEVYHPEWDALLAAGDLVNALARRCLMMEAALYESDPELFALVDESVTMDHVHNLSWDECCRRAEPAFRLIDQRKAFANTVSTERSSDPPAWTAMGPQQKSQFSPAQDNPWTPRLF